MSKTASVTHPKQRTSKGKAKSVRRGTFTRTWGPWIAIAAALVLGIAIWKTGSEPAGGAVTGNNAAPAFSLPASDGSQVSLADYPGQNVMLYFNEGVGCDACFYQMTSLEQDSAVLEKAGITKVIPIAVNPMPDVQQAVTQFGLKNPWLVDADKSVSDAYGMLGTGMHADLPGHGFVVINSDGDIVWKMNYPSMYASAQQIVKDMGGALG